MRICTFSLGGEARVGVLAGGRIADLKLACALSIADLPPAEARARAEAEAPSSCAEFIASPETGRKLAEDALATDLPAAPGAPAVEQLMSDFARRFPAGMAHDVTGRAPSALARLPSQLRVEIQRAALVFARDLRPARGPDGWEVTALVWEGSLRAIFVVPRRSPASARRAWRELVRAWVVRVAAGTPVVTTGISRTASAAAGVAAQEAPML